MKVWKVLTNKRGSKVGNVDKSTQIALIGVVAPLFVLTRNPIVAFIAIVVVFVISFVVRNHFNGRADWLFLWYRLLFKPKGTWNLNERDQKK